MAAGLGFHAAARRTVNREHKAAQLRELRELRAALGVVKRARRSTLGAAREKCAAVVAAVRQSSRERFDAAKGAARLVRDDARAAARGQCAGERVKLDRELRAEIEQGIARLESERKHQKQISVYERAGKSREKVKRTAGESRQESDDAVRANIGADLVPVFDRVRGQIKASANRSRTEAFLDWMESDRSTADQIVADLAEKELSRLLKEHTAKERAQPTKRKATRKARAFVQASEPGEPRAQLPADLERANELDARAPWLSAGAKRNMMNDGKGVADLPHFATLHEEAAKAWRAAGQASDAKRHETEARELRKMARDYVPF